MMVGRRQRLYSVASVVIIMIVLCIVGAQAACISTKYDQELSDQLAQMFQEGRQGSGVFKLLEEIDRKTLSTIPSPGHLINQEVECYEVGFTKIYLNRTEDRMFCIDDNGIVVWVVYSLSAS